MQPHNGPLQPVPFSQQQQQLQHQQLQYLHQQRQQRPQNSFNPSQFSAATAHKTDPLRRFSGNNNSIVSNNNIHGQSNSNINSLYSSSMTNSSSNQGKDSATAVGGVNGLTSGRNAATLNPDDERLLQEWSLLSLNPKSGKNSHGGLKTILTEYCYAKFWPRVEGPPTRSPPHTQKLTLVIPPPRPFVMILLNPTPSQIWQLVRFLQLARKLSRSCENLLRRTRRIPSPTSSPSDLLDI